MVYYSLSPNKRFKVNSFHPGEYANILPDVFSVFHACFDCLIDFYSRFFIYGILRIQITPFDIR